MSRGNKKKKKEKKRKRKEGEKGTRVISVAHARKKSRSESENARLCCLCLLHMSDYGGALTRQLLLAVCQWKPRRCDSTVEREGNEESRAPMKVRGRQRLQGVSGGLFRARPREKGVSLFISRSNGKPKKGRGAEESWPSAGDWEFSTPRYSTEIKPAGRGRERGRRRARSLSEKAKKRKTDGGRLFHVA